MSVEKTLYDITLKKELEKRINSYMFLEETINSYKLLQNADENIIKNILTEMKTNKYGRLRMINESKFSNITLINLLEMLGIDSDNVNEFLKKGLIVNIDKEETINNLNYTLNQPKPVLEAFDKLLDTLTLIDTKRLVIDKNE